MSAVCPRLPESNVCETDATPGEQGSQTGKRLQPSEDFSSAACELHVGNGSKCEDDDGREEWASSFVNVGEDLGGVSLLSKSSKGSRTTVDTGKTDTDDREENDHVDEVAKSWNAGVDCDNDEWRSSHIDEARSEKSRVVVWHQKPNKEESKDVEQRNSPEDLLDGTRKRLLRVLGLSGCETNQLGSREGEGCSDEDTAESQETVVESSWVVPSPGSPILRVHSVAWATTASKDDTHDHEDNDRRELQERNPKLFFRISQNTEYVDCDDCDHEYRNPYCDIHVRAPVFDC